jgi:ABC-type polysaccharide/polyol phosphate export permease
MIAVYAYLGYKKGEVSDFFYPALFFVVTMFVMIGLVTPIIGAIVRYKVPALPFLALLLITHINFSKINNSISKIAKR